MARHRFGVRDQIILVASKDLGNERKAASSRRTPHNYLFFSGMANAINMLPLGSPFLAFPPLA